jgi:nucleotide-binding universal stress UspA family protein
MITLKNVLVATDFGEASDAALMYGRGLARNFGARLHVLHVAPDALAFAGPEGYAFDGRQFQADIEVAARQRLEEVVGDDDRRELNAQAILRVSSTPALAIVSYAKEAGIDLIVVGTHGRGGMAHFFMGSVAKRVVRTAPCPVLTVRHPEHEFVLPDALQVVARER